MEALKESGMQHTAQYQLNCLDEFEAVHNDGDENIPQHIVELRLIRSYLLGVASGTIVWDAEEVARRVKLGEEGANPDKAPDSSDVTNSSFQAKHAMDFGERVAKIAKPKLSKVMSDAMSFLRSAPQSASPEGVSGASSPTDLAVVPSSEPHVEEDLISFDSDPVVTPTKNEPRDVSAASSPQNLLLDINDQVKTEPPKWSTVLSQYPTLGLSTARKEEVECFVCHKTSTELITTCLCTHQYCSNCLCNLVKSSVLGAATFPPTCCEQLVPININSAVFDFQTLRDFLEKKYGNDETTNGSPGDQKPDGELTLPPDQVLPEPEKAKQGLCYLCHRVNEKDACCSVCPDCCYRCNSSRAQCQCPWWAERQKREAVEKVVAESSFNPQAPNFNPTVDNKSWQESAVRALHRPRNSVVLEPTD
ncbi:unnamed protein product [Fusarium equiseti]|uniref:RING-type domain-containing protein n=1 Tax=Fusarium equiseti TaxID=61235 RepID=A0A8J2NHL0_FUSEQ|nr:unnamed protein product [Fusarium equiseti]